MSRFQIERSSNGAFRFRVLGSAGQTLLTSRSYGARAAVVRAIEAVRRIAGLRDSYRLRQARNGQFVFLLSARNGRALGTSAAFPTRRAAEAAMRAVLRLGVPVAAASASAGEEE